MQHLEGEEDGADLLPPISELHEHLPGLDDAGDGASHGPAGSPCAAAPAAPPPVQQPWAYGGSSTASPASGAASSAATAPTGTPPSSWASSSSGGPGGGGGGGNGTRLQPHAAPFMGGGSPSRPAGTPHPSPSVPDRYGRSRPGSAGGSAHRLSRFAQDQAAQYAQQQAQQAQHAQQVQQQQYRPEEGLLGYAPVQYGYTLQPAYGLVPVATPAYAASYGGVAVDYGGAVQQGLGPALAYGAMPMSPVASYGTLTPVASFGALAPMAQLSPTQASAPPYYPPGSPVVLARMSPVPPPPSPSGRRRPRVQQQQQQQQQRMASPRQ